MTSAKFWLWHDRIMYRALWWFAFGGVIASGFGFEMPHLAQLAAFMALAFAAALKAQQTN